MRHVVLSGWSNWLGALTLGCMAALATGCGAKGTATGDVFGEVVTQGKPVTAGYVRFFPEGGGEPVAGAIGADGKFRASGVPVGRCKVAVETQAFKGLSAPPPAIAKQVMGARPVYVPIPGKYETPQASGLEFEVKKGNNDYDIKVD